MNMVKLIEGGSGLILRYSNVPENENLSKKPAEVDHNNSVRSARARAFKRVSDILYLYKDSLTTFVTLTYRNQHDDLNKIKNDLKNYFSRKKISYIAVFERHESGNLHIHAITSDLPNVYLSEFRRRKKTENGYVYGARQRKWADWERNLGMTDVAFISDFDEKFRIEKYIFKYMAKSEKIGGRYFYKSRDLTIRENSSRKKKMSIQHFSERFLWFIDDEYSLDFSCNRVYNINGITISSMEDYYERNTD